MYVWIGMESVREEKKEVKKEYMKMINIFRTRRWIENIVMLKAGRMRVSITSPGEWRWFLSLFGTVGGRCRM